MRGFDLDEPDFIELLGSAPCTRATVQEYLQRGYGVRVPKTSYEVIWERLRQHLGDWGAADAVCELVIATAKPRVRRLLEAVEREEDVYLRMSEPRLVELLIAVDGEPTELGAYLLDYRRRTGGDTPQHVEATKTQRETIPDKVKMFVWQRDQGRCVKCSSQERLEFDHIIPVSKGGSNGREPPRSVWRWPFPCCWCSVGC